MFKLWDTHGDEVTGENNSFHLKDPNKYLCETESEVFKSSSLKVTKRGENKYDIDTTNKYGTYVYQVDDINYYLHVGSTKITDKHYRKMVNSLFAEEEDLYQYSENGGANLSSTSIAQSGWKERVNYLFHFLNKDKVEDLWISIAELVNLITRSPKQLERTPLERTHMMRLRKVGPSEIYKLIRNSGIQMHHPIHGSLNTYIDSPVTVIDDIDCYENQFVKHWLEQFYFDMKQHIADPIDPGWKNMSNILATNLENLLSNRFFSRVSPLKIIGITNPSLQYRYEYREFFKHTVRYLSGGLATTKHFYNSRLDDTNNLYELWCLLYIKKLVNDKENLLTVNKQMFSLKNHACWGYTDRTPDITIVKRDGQKIILDAKFKTMNKEISSNDVNQMHTYLDTIPNTVGAILLYVHKDQELDFDFDISFSEHTEYMFSNVKELLDSFFSEKLMGNNRFIARVHLPPSD